MRKPNTSEVIKISKLPTSRASLKEMGIPRELCGKLVTITQSCDIGISFQVNPQVGESYKEYHLTHQHAKNIFHESYGKKIKSKSA